MATPTVRWDDGFTWDMSTWDGAPLAITPEPRRTVKVVGEQARKFEFTKDPDAKLDYTFDLTGWLTPGDEVASGQLLFSTTPVAVSDITPSATSVTFWADGGRGRPASDPALIRFQWTTARGRKDARTLALRIEER